MICIVRLGPEGACVCGQLDGVMCGGVGLKAPLAAHAFGDVPEVVRTSQVAD